MCSDYILKSHKFGLKTLINMNKQIKLMLAIFLFGSAQLVAQGNFEQAEIITENGDVIVGLVDCQSDMRMAQKCRFKQDKKQKVRTYYPEELKQFTLTKQNRTFVKRRIDVEKAGGKEVFLDLLVAGKINLYYLRDRHLINRYFIEKKGEKTLADLPFSRQERYVDNGNSRKLLTIDTTNHIDTLKKYMQDTSSLYPNIEDIQFPQKDKLIKLVKLYNSFFENAVERK